MHPIIRVIPTSGTLPRLYHGQRGLNKTCSKNSSHPNKGDGSGRLSRPIIGMVGTKEDR